MSIGPDHEGGDANADHGQRHAGVVGPGVPAERGDDARRQADDQGDGQGVAAQFKGDGKCVPESVR